MKAKSDKGANMNQYNNTSVHGNIFRTARDFLKHICLKYHICVKMKILLNSLIIVMPAFAGEYFGWIIMVRRRSISEDNSKIAD